MKKERVSSGAKNQKPGIASDRAKLQDQCDAIKRAIDAMEKDVVECMELAQPKKEWTYVLKGNALKILSIWKNSIPR